MTDQTNCIKNFYDVRSTYVSLIDTLSGTGATEAAITKAKNLYLVGVLLADHSQLETIDKIALDAFIAAAIEIDHTTIWTTELFLAVTKDMSDAERCAAVLRTRDIVLISWYVNVRAGRIVKDNPSRADLENQLKIIQCELDEGFVSVNERNGQGLRDDIPDMLLTVAGMAGYYPQSIVDDFVTMVEANFTRIDGTRADAEKTKAKWIAAGIPCEITETELGTFPVTVTEATNINKPDGKVEHFPVGKFMKSYQFRSERYNHDDGNTPHIVD